MIKQNVLVNTKTIILAGVLLFNPIAFSAIDKKKDVSAYGKLGIIFQGEDNDLSMEDNGSRVGLYARKVLYGKYFLAAKGEWSFNAINNTSNLSVGNDDNFISSSEAGQTFRRRLGFISIDLKEYGELGFGKQWSVYSDVSLNTDIFNIYGGAATGTFNLRTDGGQVGTGRVSKGVTYRIQIYGFELGLQAKLIKNRNLSVNDKDVDIIAKDSFGVALRRKFFNKGLEFGFAYNQIELDGDANPTLGYDGGNSWSGVFIMKIQFSDFMVTALVNRSGNHEISDTDIIFDGDGRELVASWSVNEFYKLMLGYNELNDFNDDLSGDYKKEYYIVGLNFRLHPEAKLYIEFRANESTTTDGEKGENSLGFGGTVKF
jgi:predicted porin